ncbi:dihydrofolate reductase [Marinimicrobium agarilyticum]|uniref:dihydrofolate reductase n=1 Tax=Marinimicrobium agarilyticum TaxID=306546 RepID=UPI00040BE9B5|nr:dihydrofolate reductase [Marinimicrobium agarilyticum]
MKVSMIVAAARNGVIGRNNELPWHLPEDLKYFKSVTMGKPVIMGRKTHESIGRPLPGRLNVVISRQPRASENPDLHWVDSIEAALALVRREQPDVAEVIIMGGEEIYRQSLPWADRIYLTRVEADVEGDAFFPALDDTHWSLSRERAGAETEPYSYVFQEFERVTT